jgi:transcriptional regulator with XRE-family HTH domain
MRESIPISQKDLAIQLGIHQSALSQIESGTIYPSFPTMLYLNSTYRLNVSWLVSGEGNMFMHAIDAFTVIENSRRLDQPQYIQLLKAMEDKRIESLIFNRLSDTFIYFGKDIE